MINKVGDNIKKFFKKNRLVIGIIILALFMTVMPITYSKFQSSGKSDIKIDTAFYILDSGYYGKNIYLDSILPSDNVYTYNFSVSNFKDTKRAETDMDYFIEITTTTNLPFQYALYLNQKYSDKGAINVIKNDIVEADEYGTYFKKMSTDMRTFVNSKNETDIYQLTILFPKENASIEYQDIIEGINIAINSKQKIKENKK